MTLGYEYRNIKQLQVCCTKVKTLKEIRIDDVPEAEDAGPSHQWHQPWVTVLKAPSFKFDNATQLLMWPQIITILKKFSTVSNGTIPDIWLFHFFTMSASKS